MPATIGDMLELPSFANAKIVAGRDGLHRVVDSAALMEVPDIFSFLQPNTMLLTTLFPFVNNESLLEEFIPRLLECSTAGVCIKPHRYIDAIPRHMLEQADELGLPVIELPPEANLSTMANDILSRSLDEYIAQMQYRNNVHVSLTELLLKESGLDELTERLAKLLCRNVFILGKDMSCVCAANSDGLTLDPMQSITDDKAEELRHNKRLLLTDRHLYPIVAGKHRFGYIYTPSRPERERDCENLDIAIEQAGMLFASFFLKKEAVAKNQKNFRDVFIRDLLKGTLTSPFEISNKMVAFSMQLDFPQPVACIKLFDNSETAREKFYDLVINSGIVDGKYSRFTNQHSKHIYLVYYDDMITVVGCSCSPEKLATFFLELFPDLFELTHARNIKIGIGISDQCASVDDLSTAYRQAKTTLETGAALNKQSFVDTYAQRRLFSIIEHVDDRRMLEQFVMSKIGAVIDYDRENGTDLMETLGLLIDGELNYKTVAERSFVHYNTVRYRATKIKQLGIPLTPGRDFAEVVVAHDCWIWLKASEAQHESFVL